MKELCKARKIVFSHLPDHAAVGRTHFWAVTQLRSTPSLEWLCDIAKALDADVADLLSAAADETPRPRR